MYFESLPLVVYSMGSVSKLVTNILTRIIVSDTMLASIYMYDQYVIEDNETPESISYDVYGDTQYHWVIMICNNIIYPWNDWPMSTETLNDYVKAMYGVGNLYSVHHYVNVKGFIVNPGGVGAMPVSNYEYETQKNDAKRSINILNPSLLSSFISQFNILIQASK